MELEQIKSTLVSTEKQVIDLRNKANSEDANDSTRFELKNLIDRRVEAFVRLVNDFSMEQYREVCSAMGKARAA